MRGSERGFVLLEILVLCLVLLACLGSMKMLDRAARLNAADGARSQALFLAREELEWLNYYGANGSLATGTYGWQGEEADVTRGDVTFAPTAQVYESDTPTIRAVYVTVTWNSSTTSGQLELEGRIKNEQPTANAATAP